MASDHEPERGRPTSVGGSHSAFERLAPGIQRRLYAMRWPSLRPVQVRTIAAFFDSPQHIVVMAETASGKTEAAFLPILSVIAEEAHGSVRAVYVGPLKALINDQFGRLEQLCAHLDVPVHRWHGDVGAAEKEALTKNPGGVLLITPESLESLLVNRTASLSRMFGGLRAVVIDELHSFLAGERGLHLASLLVRIARYRDASEPPIRLVGLSATIGDPRVAQSYLSPDDPKAVTVIASDGESAEFRMRVHGYDAALLATTESLASTPADTRSEKESGDTLVLRAIAEDVVEHCRSSSNLVFANSKGDIEILADFANEECRRVGFPETFLVHHGSLSRDVREDAEARMKSERAHTAVCSSTLEMGVDIGSVRLVGQVGAPWSCSSLKQRMGRSGRRSGEARRLRCYTDCTTSREEGAHFDALASELLQTIAVCDLMLSGWVEPPEPGIIDLSTLTHQVISTIAERGAETAADLHSRLCVEGPFRNANGALFVRLLRDLGRSDVVEQGSDGRLFLGLMGERLRAKRDYYAVFASRVEFSVIAGNRLLGTLPIETLPKPLDHIVFAARRWQVSSVDIERAEVHVEPARRVKRPVFLGSAGHVHHRIRERMLEIVRSDTPFEFLDASARDALASTRRSAAERGLDRRATIELSSVKCLWATWSGSVETTTYEAFLQSIDVASRNERVGLVCDCSKEKLDDALARASAATPSMSDLAHHVPAKRRRKYDEYLSDELLDVGLASELRWLPFVRTP